MAGENKEVDKPHPTKRNLEENENAVSMVDILEEEKQLEADAKAVLGDSDDKNCTYLMGYVPRQALYACITCVSGDQPPAGVCLACSYECHEGHELVELYTKRYFRCDCGNSRYGAFECKLQKEKCPENKENKYNQNFKGKYCTCARPYPDPDDSVEDEMIQCILCEDWYHGRHLLGKQSTPENFDEMVCHQCMEQTEFLNAYRVYSVSEKKMEPDQSVTGEPQGSSTDPSSEDNDTSDKNPNVTEKSSDQNVDVCGEVPGTCQLEKLKGDAKSTTTKEVAYWPMGWRGKLCQCSNCMKIYSDKSITFLLDEDDTVHAYEERGEKKRGTTSDYDQGMQALSSMNRIQQVEMVQGYNDLKGELKEYLKKFAENGKVVREEDIKEFFSSFQSRKKQKVDMQWSCK